MTSWTKKSGIFVGNTDSQGPELQSFMDYSLQEVIDFRGNVYDTRLCVLTQATAYSGRRQYAEGHTTSLDRTRFGITTASTVGLRLVGTVLWTSLRLTL